MIQNLPGISLIPGASGFLNDLLGMITKMDSFGDSILGHATLITDAKTKIQQAVISKVTAGLQTIKAQSAAATEKVIQSNVPTTGGGVIKIKRSRYNKTMRKK